MTWTRAHDAWLARECEGLEVSDRYGSDWHEIRAGRPWKPVAHYATDPADCIRAAEAWQVAGPDRRIVIDIDRDGKRVQAYNGTQWQSAGGRDTAAALAQALIRATGGPV